VTLIEFLDSARLAALLASQERLEPALILVSESCIPGALNKEGHTMKSSVVKRSVLLGNHKTSVSVEQPFWNGMKEISRERGKTLSELVSEINSNRQQGNLSSAIRLFVLDYFKTTAEGNASNSVDAKRVA
jgi:predicted DNA-binding ribbon-helix-helix protein